MNRFKNFFYDSILFRLIALIVYVPMISLLYLFFSIEVSLMITLLFSNVEVHKDLIDEVIKKKEPNSITPEQIQSKIDKLQKRIDEQDFEHWRDENDIQDDIFAIKRMLLILEGYVNE